MSSRRQKHITELITGNRSYYRGDRYRQVQLHVLWLQGGGFRLLGVQAVAVISITIWAIGISYILLKVIDVTIGLRVPLQQEILGADLVEHAVGAMEYCKRTNAVKSMRRVGNAMDVERSSPGDSPEKFNGARRRRRDTKTLNTLLDALVVMQSVSGANGELDKVVAQAMDATDTSQNGKTPHLLWKYAVGKSMNKDQKEKRKHARKNMSFLMKNRKLYGKQESVEDSTSASKSNGAVPTGGESEEDGSESQIDEQHNRCEGFLGRTVMGKVNDTFVYDSGGPGDTTRSSRYPPECRRGTADGQAPSTLSQTVIQENMNGIILSGITPTDPPHLTVTYI